MSGICQQAKIVILEILQCIPVVIIFTFLDLGKNISFSDSLLGRQSFIEHQWAGYNSFSREIA